MDTLKQAVEEFLKAKKYIYGFNRDTVERLLRGNTTKALEFEVIFPELEVELTKDIGP